MRLFNLCRSGSESCRPKTVCGGILFYGGHALLALLVITAVALIFGWAVMLTWNAVIPGIFNLPAISFWQAVALLILVRILVHRHHRRRHGWHRRSEAPPEGGDYSQWWWEEGEAAFKAHQARKAAEK